MEQVSDCTFPPPPNTCVSACVCVFLPRSITGLTAIVTINCTASEPTVATNLAWSDYVNPCALLLLYFYFTFETNRTLFQRVNHQSILVPDFIDDHRRFLCLGTIEHNDDPIGRTSGKTEKTSLTGHPLNFVLRSSRLLDVPVAVSRFAQISTSHQHPCFFNRLLVSWLKAHRIGFERWFRPC